VCGRYQRRSDKQRIAETFAVGNVDGLALELAPDYNVAPQTMQPVIVRDEEYGTRTLHMMFWRFLPRFVTDPKQFKLSTINAKGESVFGGYWRAPVKNSLLSCGSIFLSISCASSIARQYLFQREQVFSRWFLIEAVSPTRPAVVDR
jgi:hypothetical protein